MLCLGKLTFIQTYCLSVLTYQVLTAEMPVQTRSQTATATSTAPASNAVTVTTAPKPIRARTLPKKTEKKTANATTQTQECSHEDRQQVQINTKKNTNDCKCWDCVFGYKCIRCENKFYDYLDLKKIEEIRICNKNKSLGRCKCRFFIGHRIYECWNCFVDLKTWYHTPEYKNAMAKIYNN